jgi:hypothetical protein
MESLYATDLARIGLSLIPKIDIPVVPYLTHVPFEGTEFSDCAETALLNIINQLGFSPESDGFSLDFLVSKKGVVLHPQLIAYYKNFPTPSTQMSPKAHSEFAAIIAGNPNLSYERTAKFELLPNAHNMLKSLAYLIFHDTDYLEPDEILKKLETFGSVTLENNLLTITTHVTFKVQCSDAHAQFIPPLSADSLSSIFCIPEQFEKKPTLPLEQLLTSFIAQIAKKTSHTYCFDALANQAKYGIRFALTQLICIDMYKKEALFFARNSPELLPYLPDIIQRWAFANPDFRDEQSRIDIISKIVRDWASDKNIAPILIKPYGTTSLLESFVQWNDPEDTFERFFSISRKGPGCSLLSLKQKNSQEIVEKGIAEALKKGNYLRYGERELKIITLVPKDVCIKLPENFLSAIALHTEIGTLIGLAKIISTSRFNLLNKNFMIQKRELPKTQALFAAIKAHDTKLGEALKKYLANETAEQKTYRQAVTKSRENQNSTILEELTKAWPHKDLDAFAQSTTLGIYGSLIFFSAVQELLEDGIPSDILNEIAPNPLADQ